MDESGWIMDWRSACVLAMVLLIGGVGCLETRPVAQSRCPQGSGPGPANARSQKVHAHLFVAYAQMQENNADQPNVPEQTQQQLREDARLAYQKALDAEPKNPDALVALGRLASRAGDMDRAKQYLAKATQYYPKARGCGMKWGCFTAGTRIGSPRWSAWAGRISWIRRIGSSPPITA